MVLSARRLLAFILLATLPTLEGCSKSTTSGGNAAEGGRPEIRSGELRIAYLSDTGGNSDIYTMTPQGTSPFRLTTHPANDFGPRLRGSRVIFGSLRTGRAILYEVELTGSEPVEVYRNTGGDEVPDWSPDGTFMVYSSERNFNDDIYVARPDGTPERRLTTSPGRDTAPRWSPDGSQIAFVSERDGNAEIYIINADGSNLRNLTQSAESEGHPAWSPDGSRLLFHRVLADGNPDIFVQPLNGGAASNLTNHPSWELVSAWSPDGDRIAFGSNRDGNWEVYTMTPSGEDVKRLTTNPGFDGDPIWVRLP